MKKFTTLLTMAFIALMSISFTSCDDDSDIAYTLDGTWRGNMLVDMTGATIGTTMTVGATASSIRAWRTPRLFLAELRIL